MLAEGTLKGRRAVVTGGGTGIGLAIAKELARLGADVAIASRKVDVLEKAVEEISPLATAGNRVRHHQLDVRQPEAVEAVAARVAEDFGGPADILVNNAAGNFVVPALDLSPNGWKAVIDIVLNGTFYCSQAFGKRMIEAGRGDIVNLLAIYAWHGGPGTIHSACAKAGVLAMTRTLAVEWASTGVRVNAVAPGPVENTGGADKLFSIPEVAKAVLDDVPLHRFCKPEEVAWAVSYLVSPFASYVTGECLVMDGGQWLGKGFTRLAT